MLRVRKLMHGMVLPAPGIPCTLLLVIYVRVPMSTPPVQALAQDIPWPANPMDGGGWGEHKDGRHTELWLARSMCD